MSNPMVQLQEATIKAQCKTLRMPMVASQFGTLAEQAIREKQSHIGYLEALLLAEIEERERNTIERRIRDAHLPRMKTLEEFDYTQSPNVTAAKMRDLAEGGYIDRDRPQHDSTPHPGRTSSTHENAGGVRLHAVAECDGGEDARPGRRRLYRSGRTRPLYRRMRHRQDPPAHRTLRGGMPAEATGTFYHRGRSGQRTGGGQASVTAAARDGPLESLRSDCHRGMRIRSLGRGRRRVPVSGRCRASRESRSGADHEPALFRVDAGHPERATLQSVAGSNHRSSSHPGDGHGILSLPPNCGKAKEGSQDARNRLSCGNDGQWKAWKTKIRFSTLPTALGNRFAIPTFPQLRRLLIYRVRQKPPC